MFLVLDRDSGSRDLYVGFQLLEGERGMNSTLQYVDTGLIFAVLMGVAHVLIKVGAMQTKIDTMWDWYKEHVK